MTDWIDTRNRLPHDLKLKLVTVHNLHQGRLYVTVATYNPVGGRWEPVTGSVIAWMDAPKPYRR